MKQSFIDLICEDNLTDGLEYYAAGIITECYMVDAKPSASGKDYCVSYIDPWGIVHHEWRGHDEIKLIDMNTWDYEILKIAITNLQAITCSV